jgi:hypothetical protein
VPAQSLAKEQPVTSSVGRGPQQIWIAYNDAANRGAHDLAAAYIAPDLTVLVNGHPAIASAEDDRAVQSELIRCYPDYSRSYEYGIEDGDRAAIEWRMRGTPADGVDLPALDVSGCSLLRCAEGRIVEARLYHPPGALDRVADRALGHG